MQVTPATLTLVMLFTAIGGVLVLPLGWLLLSIFTPKTLLDRYFKEPHFTLAETYMLREFPGFLLRTSIWGWALVLPFLDRKRNIKNVRAYMPLWYATALRVLTFGMAFTFTVILVLLILLFLLEDYSPNHVFFTLPGHWAGA